MLKSTHRSQQPSGASLPPPLPPGWTEHKAPTGHTYYYNHETKQSTYKRPELQPQPSSQFQAPSFPPHAFPGLFRGAPFQHHPSPSPSDRDRGRDDRFHGSRRPSPEDRPKHRDVIPSCEPWLLVRTKLRRRFVHNPETGESFWKFPQSVMKGVVELDRLQREKRQRKERGEESEEERAEDKRDSAETGPKAPAREDSATKKERRDSDGDYEEVEVTDDEDDDESDAKRQRTEEGQPQPVDFDEDDIAYQLAAMGEGDLDMDDSYGIEDSRGSDEAAAAGGLTDEDSTALFHDLLDDHRINPYTTWEAILARGAIIDDPRYVALPNMRSRRDAFDAWSRARIPTLQAARAQQERADPRIPYLALLDRCATPKLYWAEFRRRFRKEPAMRDAKLADRDRERLYREHVARLKLPRRQREEELLEVLRGMPLTGLNQGSHVEALPSALLANVKLISLPAEVREPLIEEHIASLAPAPEGAALEGVEEAEMAARRLERERREKALEERERRVQEEKKRQQRELGYSKGRMREEEMALQRAMRVGKEGLRAQLGGAGDEE